MLLYVITFVFEALYINVYNNPTICEEWAAISAGPPCVENTPCRPVLLFNVCAWHLVKDSGAQIISMQYDIQCSSSPNVQ